MAQYDGSIRINTQINSKNANAQLMSLEGRITKTAEKVASLRSKMDSLKDAKIPTQEYKAIESDIAKAETELGKLIEKQSQMQRDGKDSGAAWNGLNQRIQASRDYIELAREEMQQLVDTGRAFTLGSDTQEYSNLGQQLRYAENDLSVLTQRHNELIARQNGVKSGYQKIGKVVKSVFSTTVNVVKKAASAFSALGKGIKKAASFMSGFGKNAKATSGSLNSGLKTMLKYGLGIRSLYVLVNKFRSAVKEGFGNLAQASAPVNKSLSSLKSALTQLKNSFATAFAPILTAIAPAITALINMASRAATAVGMLIAALTGQKTFTKAVAVQEDYAASLEKTGNAAKKANKQLSGLDKLNNLSSNNSDKGDGGSGVSPGDMFETVNITPKISDFAKKLKEAWEKSDFTEIGATIGRKLKEGLEKIPWSEIQETAAKVGKSLATLINGFVKVPGLAYTIGNTIAQAINTGLIGLNSFAENLDWGSVGTFIAEGINGVLENIDWKTALSAAKLFGTGIATTLNNALTPEVFSNIGTTIGNGINTALTFANSFLTTFNWSQFGSGIATGLNSAISSIDWNLVGTTIGNALNAFFGTLGSFAEKFDWSGFGLSVGTSVSTAIQTFDWSGAGKSLVTFVNGLLNSLKSFMDNTDFEGLGKGITTAISTFFGNLDWGSIGGGIASFASSMLSFLSGLIQGVDWKGIPSGILNAISGFFTGADYKSLFGSIGKLIASAIVAGIDLLAGIGDALASSWNKVVDYFKKHIKASGGNIVLGLFNGIIEGIKGIGSWIKTNIFDPFINGFKSVFGINSPSTVMAEQGGFITSGLLNGLKSGITTVLTWLGNLPGWFKEKFVQAYELAKSAFSGIGSWFSRRFTDVKNAFSGIGSWFKEKFVSAYSGIKSVFSSIGSWFGSRWKDIKNVFSSGNGVSGWFKEKFSAAWTAIKSAFSSAGSFFGGVWGGIKSAFGNITGWFKEKFSAAWQAVKDVFSTGGKVFNGIKEGILSELKNVINMLISGINKVIAVPLNGLNAVLGKLKSLSIAGIEPFSWMPTITVPQIPKLATGAVIPANKEFLAVLGDQKHGRNLEAPEDLIRKIVREETAKNNSSGGDVTVRIPVEVDGKVLFELIKKFDLEQYQRTGKPSFQM